ncbi:DUF2306 domain-containing protein [Altererythrobacter sp. MF3-039]|uniref:DUF2306 domain-containing protein n=1 Tax=Altererythrobacter sp. MF3-039 TaxID=3252901 RepID=UPI00390CB4CB
MTSLARNIFAPTAAKPPHPMDIGPAARTGVMLLAGGLLIATMIALVRGLTGLAPQHPNSREIAIVIHVATVLPAIPLGAWLLLAGKGGALHKLLGKIWIALMLTTASSAIFIQTGGSVSLIHLFVPLTFWVSYKVVATARRGDIKAHRSEILGLYFGALGIPGLVALVLPGRLLNTWLFW